MAIMNPWNFGITPSEYYDSLDPEFRKQLNYDAEYLDYLDHLFHETLKCPEPRKLDNDSLEILILGKKPARPLKENDYSLALAAAYCKPMSEITVYNHESKILSELERLGLHYRIIKPENGSFHSYNQVAAGFSEYLLDEFIKKKSGTTVHGSTEWKKYRTTFGLLMGFPVAEIFAYNLYGAEDDFDSDESRGVIHTSWPRYWSDTWDGSRANKHLRDIYRQYVPGMQLF